MSHNDDHLTKIHDMLGPITYRSQVKDQPWGLYGLEAFSQGINVNEVGMDHAAFYILNRGGGRGNRIDYVKVKKQYEVTAPALNNPGSLYLTLTPVTTPLLAVDSSTGIGTSTSSEYLGEKFTLVSNKNASRTYEFSHETTGTILTGPSAGNIAIQCETREDLDGDGSVTDYTKKSTRELILEIIKALKTKMNHRRRFTTSPTESEVNADPVVVNFGTTIIITPKGRNPTHVSSFSSTSALLTVTQDFTDVNANNVWAFKGYKPIIDEHRHAFYEDIRTDKMLEGRRMGEIYRHHDESTNEGSIWTVKKFFGKDSGYHFEKIPTHLNSSGEFDIYPPAPSRYVHTFHLPDAQDTTKWEAWNILATSHEPFVHASFYPHDQDADGISDIQPYTSSGPPTTYWYQLSSETPRWPSDRDLYDHGVSVSSSMWRWSKAQQLVDPEGVSRASRLYWLAESREAEDKLHSVMQKSIGGSPSVVPAGNDLFNIDQRLEDAIDPTARAVGYSYTSQLVKTKAYFKPEEIPNTARDNHLFHERDRLESHLENIWVAPSAAIQKRVLSTQPMSQATRNMSDFNRDGTVSILDVAGTSLTWSFDRDILDKSTDATVWTANNVDGSPRALNDRPSFEPYSKNPKGSGYDPSKAETNSTLEAYIAHYLDNVVNQENYIKTENEIIDGRIDFYGRVARALDTSISPIFERQPYGIAFGSYEKYESFQNIIENRFPKRDSLQSDHPWIDQPGYKHVCSIKIWDGGEPDSDGFGGFTAGTYVAGTPYYQSNDYLAEYPLDSLGNITGPLAPHGLRVRGYYIGTEAVFPSLQEKIMGEYVQPFIINTDPRTDFWNLPNTWTNEQIAEDNSVMFIAYSDGEPIDHHDFYEEDRYSPIDNDFINAIANFLPKESLDPLGNPVQVQNDEIIRYSIADQFRQELYVYQATGYISEQGSRQDGTYYVGYKR